VSRAGKHKNGKKRPDGYLAPTSALSPENPLERCVINSGWRESHMASIIIVRKAPNGFTAVGFLVDTMGLGLKDAFAHKGLNRILLEQLLEHAAGGDGLVDCPLSLAQQLVHGGLAWARKYGFRAPTEAIRCLKIIPAPSGEFDISLFGTEGGSPLIVGDIL